MSCAAAGVDGISSCAAPGLAHFAQTHAHTLLSPMTPLQQSPALSAGAASAGATGLSPTCRPFENCIYEPKPQLACCLQSLNPQTYCAAASSSVYPYFTPPHNAFYGAAGVHEAASPGPMLPLAATSNANANACASALYAQQYSHAWAQAQAQGMSVYPPLVGAGIGMSVYQPQASLSGLSLGSVSGSTSLPLPLGLPHECRAHYGFSPPTCSPTFDLHTSAFGARTPGQALTSALGGGWLDNSQVAPSL